ETSNESRVARASADQVQLGPWFEALSSALPVRCRVPKLTLAKPGTKMGQVARPAPFAFWAAGNRQEGQRQIPARCLLPTLTHRLDGAHERALEHAPPVGAAEHALIQPLR